MTVGTLQHFTVEPLDLEVSKDFYCSVLGLQEGHRPDLGYPGYWLYVGDQAIVHLLGKRVLPEGVTPRLEGEKYIHTGRFDHIAFAASDLNEMKRHIAKHHVRFREVTAKSIGLVQLLFKDPDGIDLELNFPFSE